MLARQLYLRLYVAFLGVLLAIMLVIVGVGWLTGRPFLAHGRGGPRFAVHIARMLPLGDPVVMARAIDDIHEELGVDVMVVGPAGEDVPLPRALPSTCPTSQRCGSCAPKPTRLDIAWWRRRCARRPAGGAAALPPGAVRQAVARAALLLLGVLAVWLGAGLSALALNHPAVEKLRGGRGVRSRRSSRGAAQPRRNLG